MELPIVLTILLTVLSPYAAAVVNRVQWSSETKNLVALTLSIIIAVLYLLLTGGIADWSQLGIVIPAIYGLQQAAYNFILKNSATKLEAATTAGAVVVSPTPTPGTVNITTDKTIEDETNQTPVETPIQIITPPEAITNETPSKG
jgi:hypothetical protein